MSSADQEIFRGGGGGGGGYMPDDQKTAWTTFLSFFSPQLILQFSEGAQLFPREGGGGVCPNANFFINPYSF